MQTTTSATIRDDFVSQIRQITPAHPRLQQFNWAPVDQMGDVPGDRPRLFYVMMGFPDLSPVDSIWGDGITLESEVQVWTNYGGLKDSEIDGVIPADGRQLYLTLEARLDPQLPGLTTVEYSGFTPEADEPGHVWGSHNLIIRYLAGDSP